MNDNTSTAFSPADWGDYAHQYDALLHLEPYRRLLDDVIDLLEATTGDNILDLGCGTGNLLVRMAAASDISLTGVDYDEHMLSRAREKCPKSTELVRTNINDVLPWADSSFNKIACVNALYTFHNPANSLREAARLLRPGGTIVISTPKEDYENGLILRAHAHSNEPELIWMKAHASPEREESLIRRAFEDEEVVQHMLCIAEYNRHISQTTTFHFFNLPKLVQLIEDCGFAVTATNTAYADQNLLVTAKKEAK